MATGKRYNNSYMYDNLARQIERNNYTEAIGQPLRKREAKQVPLHEKEKKKEVVAQPAKLERRLFNAVLGVTYSLALALAVAVIGVLLVRYVTLTMEAGQKSKQVTALQKQLANEISLNDNLEMNIEASIDYEYIYKYKIYIWRIEHEE